MATREKKATKQTRRPEPIHEPWPLLDEFGIAEQKARFEREWHRRVRGESS